jgi:hypothetical protein
MAFPLKMQRAASFAPLSALHTSCICSAKDHQGTVACAVRARLKLAEIEQGNFVLCFMMDERRMRSSQFGQNWSEIDTIGQGCYRKIQFKAGLQK